MGYLVYHHSDEVKPFEKTIGLGAPPPTNSPAASASTQPPSSSVPASTPEITPSPSTNEVANPPLVGKPRPALPARDHWNWTTTDGKTYQDVKIEKIEGEYVTVLHADGGARILITTLPDDVQKELNYYSAQTQ